MEKSNNKDNLALIVGGVLVLVSGILCGSFLSYNTTLSIKSNIESAIVKGIDPIAVRCAYGSSSDIVCITYAARK